MAAGLWLAAGLVAAGGAHAQVFPTRPITIVVPYPAQFVALIHDESAKRRRVIEGSGATAD